MKIKKGAAAAAGVFLMLLLAACDANERQNSAGMTDGEAQVWQEGTEKKEESTAMVSEAQTAENTETLTQEVIMEQNVFYITVGENRMTAVFEDNSSAEAFKELLKEGDVSVAMSDYGDFEKVGSLGVSLPRNDTPIDTVPGDVILYQGSSITIYYDTNSWNFTRLGKIENVTTKSMKEFLGDGDVQAVFSLQ